jgi:methionine-S-sulfoxide reductase
MLKAFIIICSSFLVGCNQAKSIEKESSSQNSKTFNMNQKIDTITLGGGCYWCMEAIFQRLKGVENIESGFSGGAMKNPTYREVCTGQTGHAEVVQITYDGSIVSFPEILKIFFTMHDPTTLNRQGNDRGTQYRSVIFYRNEQQKMTAEDLIKALNKSNAYPAPIVTEVKPFEVFYKAEDYHQNYYNENSEEGYCRFVIQPKIEKFEKVFKDYAKH